MNFSKAFETFQPSEKTDLQSKLNELPEQKPVNDSEQLKKEPEVLQPEKSSQGEFGSLNPEEKHELSELDRQFCQLNWPEAKDIIPSCRWREEVKHYRDCGLQPMKINGRDILANPDIDWYKKMEDGLTNLERAETGKAPLVDGHPVEIHHIGQEKDGPIAELTWQQHHGDGNYSTLHDKEIKNPITLSERSRERREYWKARAAAVKEEINEQ